MASVGKAVSLRLKDDQVERLQKAGRRLGRTPPGAAVPLLEEALRQRDLPFIEFRDTVVGRQAFIRGIRVKVCQVEWIARDYGKDVAAVADHLGLPAVEVAGALQYAEAYPEEINAAIADNSPSVEELRRLIPNLEVFRVDASSA